MDDLKYLEALRQSLKLDFEKDIAAVDYLIARRTKQLDGAPFALVHPKSGTEVPNGSARGPGRPGKVTDAVRDAIRKAGKSFSLYDILNIMEQQQPGHGFKRKAISSALGRLASDNKELKPIDSVNGQKVTTYVITEKFPQVSP